MSDPDMESLLPEVPGPRAGDSVGSEGEPGQEADLADEGDQSAEGEGSSPRTIGRLVGQALPGSPSRRSRALPALLALAVALGVAAGFVARGFVSPAQQAAQAQAPQPSLITAPVRFGVLPVLVAMRANVSNGHSLGVSAPSGLSGSLPVVTSVNVRPGERVGQGQLLFTVAERPVFLFQGK